MNVKVDGGDVAQWPEADRVAYHEWLALTGVDPAMVTMTEIVAPGVALITLVSLVLSPPPLPATEQGARS